MIFEDLRDAIRPLKMLFIGLNELASTNWSQRIGLNELASTNWPQRIGLNDIG